MTLELDDTIAALASPPGPAARGIVRISGPAVRETLDGLFAPDDVAAWKCATTAARHPGRFQLKDVAVPLPMDVYLWPNCRSYTGQPAAELHAIGSPPLLEAVLSTLYAAGVRAARPGEFTLRAFLSGRLDLMQAEAVLGVIDAADHEELETALRQLAGGLSGPLADIRGDLLDLLADLEAGLDFVEEDIEFVSAEQVAARIDRALAELKTLAAQATQRMRTTGRPRVVLAGLPNAGKSTLFNALVRREAALVSEQQGTTRDYLSAELDLAGAAVELVDTAGWDAGSDALIEQAQLLRQEQFAEADLIVWCRTVELERDEADTDAKLFAAVTESDLPLLLVQTKSDLNVRGDRADALHVSAKAGAGLEQLSQAIASQLSETQRGDRQLLGVTAARCGDSLAHTIEALTHALESVRNRAGDELVALELRDALDQLGQILGAVYTDDVLDRVFSRFCIGK